jgi:hypothetical protein
VDDITYWALAGLGAITALLWMKVRGLAQKLKERDLKEQAPAASPEGEKSDAFELRDHVPALRQVINASIWFSREYANTVMGLTDEELQQLKPNDVEWSHLPENFLPGLPIRIETWSLHEAPEGLDVVETAPLGLRARIPRSGPPPVRCFLSPARIGSMPECLAGSARAEVVLSPLCFDADVSLRSES